MKQRKSIILGIAIVSSAILASLLINSCKTQKAISSPLETFKPKIYVVDHYIHDTIPKSLKRMSSKELQEYLTPVYNNLFLPEFNKLNGIIIKQQNSIDNQSKTIIGLTNTISSIRSRNIRVADSLNRIQYLKDQKYEKLQSMYSEREKSQIAKNKTQIDNLNQISNIFLAAAGVILLCIIALFILNYFLWRKIEKLRENRNVQ